MSLAPAPHRHPMVAALDALSEVLDQAAHSNPAFLTVREKEAVLLGLSQAGQRLQGLLLSVLSAADDVAAEHGARNVADWLAHHTRSDYGPVARRARLAEALDTRWQSVADALLDGRVSEPQAEVIVAALGALPGEVDPEIRAKAEAHLIAEASRYTPKQLRILGRRVLEVVAPDAFDDEERRLLEAEERRALSRTSLTLRANGDGTTDLRARVPDSVGERLRIYLEAYAAPRREVLTGSGAAARRPYSQRLGEAFCSLLEKVPAALLPAHGGDATTVLVTITLDQLRSGLGGAGLASGGRISAAEARRLACGAGLVPAVLGGASEVLDLGRASRLFSPAQRKALALRDGRCRAEGCTIPAPWCEAHHRDPWSRGGKTDLADGVLLCSFHHHRAHDATYDHTHLASGDVRFHRRR